MNTLQKYKCDLEMTDIKSEIKQEPKDEVDPFDYFVYNENDLNDNASGLEVNETFVEGSGPLEHYDGVSLKIEDDVSDIPENEAVKIEDHEVMSKDEEDSEVVDHQVTSVVFKVENVDPYNRRSGNKDHHCLLEAHQVKISNGNDKRREENVEDEEEGSKDDGDTDGGVNSNDKILFRRIERSEYPKLILKKIFVKHKDYVHKGQKARVAKKIDDIGNILSSEKKIRFHGIEESIFPKVLLRKLFDHNKKAKEMATILRVNRIERIFVSLPSKSSKLGEEEENRRRTEERIGFRGAKWRLSKGGRSCSKLCKCLQCEYATEDKSNFMRHMKTHSGPNLFRCLQCSYETNRKEGIKIHLLNHSDMRLYKCTKCNYGCNTKRSLTQHNAVHANSKLFKCRECNLKFHKKGNLDIHMLNHTLILSNTKLFKCTECSFKADRKEDLKKHLREHLLKFRKNSGCNTIGSLSQPLTVHESERLLKCYECEFECSKKSALDRHILNHMFIHPRAKLFRCTDCAYEVDCKEDLKRHFREHLMKFRKN